MSGVHAEVTLAMHDAEALQHYFDLCAQQFTSQRDGTLMKKFERPPRSNGTLAPAHETSVASRKAGHGHVVDLV